MNVRPIFRWFDLWIGVFVDVPNRRVYVFPAPCFGLRIEGGERSRPVRWALERLARVRRRAALGLPRFPWLASKLSEFELVIVTHSRWGGKSGAKYEGKTSEARSYRIGLGRFPIDLPEPIKPDVKPAGRFVDALTLAEQADRAMCEVICEEGHTVWAGPVCDSQAAAMVECHECDCLDSKYERHVSVDWRTLGVDPRNNGGDGA